MLCLLTCPNAHKSVPMGLARKTWQRKSLLTPTPSPRRQPQTPWASAALATGLWNIFSSMSRFGLVCDHIASTGGSSTIV